MPGRLINPADMNGIQHGIDLKEQGTIQTKGQALQNGLVNGIDHASPPTSTGLENGKPAEPAVPEGSSGAFSRSAPTSGFGSLPPEIQHISLLSLAKLINRSAQQTWNDLTELVNELSEIQVPPETAQINGVYGKSVGAAVPLGNQHKNNLDKKDKILSFGQMQRDNFIKLLVVSDWSRNAEGLSKLIDINVWMHEQKRRYYYAAHRLGEIKRDLANAQVPNPDLRTAVEVLSTGRVANLPDLNYIPPKSLSSKQMVETLRQINQILCSRLVLNEQIPPAFETYHIHDGRVTFSASEEFEVDLSVADEDPKSQFFFMDFRFLFSPAPEAANEQLRQHLEGKLNAILLNDGLDGCYAFLHDLTLSYKLNVLRKQALDLSQGQWSENLRIDLIHRTLVVQYWTNRTTPKSWIEIGIHSGRQLTGTGREVPGPSHLAIKWMRQKQEIRDHHIHLETGELSMEQILRSVVASHTCWILDSIYEKISQHGLYQDGTLSLDLEGSYCEPSDCYLQVQFTISRTVTMCIEPVSGTFAFKPISQYTARAEFDIGRSQDVIEDASRRLAFVRCVEAEQALAEKAFTAGWETSKPPKLSDQADFRQLFPRTTLRYIFFRRPMWGTSWLVAATHSMDGDSWWLLNIPMGDVMPTAEIIQGFQLHLEEYHASFFSKLDTHICCLMSLRTNINALSDLGTPVTNIILPRKESDLRDTGPQASFTMLFAPERLPQSVRLREPFRIRKNGNSLGTYIRCIIQYRPISRKILVRAQSGYDGADVNYQPLPPFTLQNNTLETAVETPIDDSVVTVLLQRFQLASFLFACRSSLLQYSRLTVRSTSLNHITFRYSEVADLTATINFSACSTSSIEPLSPPSTSLNFSPSSPHLRIRDSLLQDLTSQLSGPSGLDNFVRLLDFTLPLLSVFDTMQTEIYPPTELLHVNGQDATTSPGNSPPSSPFKTLPKFHVLARGPQSYCLRYVRPSASFEINTIRRGNDGFFWVLRYSSHPEDLPLVKQMLLEHVFGPGVIVPADFAVHGSVLEKAWVPLDDGAACKIQNPAPLLRKIWEVLREVVAELEKATPTGRDREKGKTAAQEGHHPKKSQLGNESPTVGRKKAGTGQSNSEGTAPQGQRAAPPPSASRTAPGGQMRANAASAQASGRPSQATQKANTQGRQVIEID